jgi:hypothetical protein
MIHLAQEARGVEMLNRNFLHLITPAFAQPINLKNEYAFGEINTFGQGVSYLVMPAFAVAGVILVFWFLWGAFDIIISQGEKERIAAGRNRITHTIIGFLMLIAMFLILQYLPQFLLRSDFNFISPK